MLANKLSTAAGRALVVLIVASFDIALVAGNARKNADRVSSLPGLVFNENVNQYSGYLNATSNRFLHYWLIESQGNPATDPLILWFNGGPGCSSLIGLFDENGPFHVNKDNATLWENIYSWNKLGNMIFLEGPTGVGFSYSNPQADSTSDNKTAVDFYMGLRDFFANVMPEYQGRDFYITGESYAGVYIPTLTTKIIDGMKSQDFLGKLVGIAIGNGILSEKKQHNSVVDFMYFHGLIGDDLWNQLKIECCLQSCETRHCDWYDNLVMVGGNDWKAKNTKCGNLSYLVSEQLLWNSANDAYNVYQDCYRGNSIVLMKEMKINYPRLISSNQAANINYQSTDANDGFACWGSTARTVYLNQPAVWKALHIPPVLTSRMQNDQNGNPTIPWQWGGCADFNYQRTDREMEPWFDYIWKNSNIRMLIYNGDVDMVCNFLGDEWFMTNFTKSWNIPVTQKRAAWHYRGQIGGYVKRYQRIDVLTVKGSGHFVPQDRPGPALQMITNFIRNSQSYSTSANFSITPYPMKTNAPPTQPTNVKTTTSGSQTMSSIVDSYLTLAIFALVLAFRRQ